MSNLHSASIDDLSEDILGIIARAVPGAALFTILLLSHQFNNLMKARVVQLAALRGPPFHLSPSLILDFNCSSLAVNLHNIGDIGMQVLSRIKFTRCWGHGESRESQTQP